MIRNDDHLPFRQATRLVNEFQLNASAAANRICEGDLDQAAALLLILRLCIRNPAILNLSVNAIAASLQRPAETMRRAVLALTERGFCTRSGRYSRRHPDFRGSPDVVDIADHIVRQFDHMIEGFERTGFELPAGIATSAPPAKLAAALDVYLSAFELSESGSIDPLSMLVLGAVSVANARRITHEPDLARRYGFDTTIPPDDVREPLTIKKFSTRFDVPYSTAWRRAKALEKIGALRRTPSGYLLADVYMDNPRTSALSREKIRYVRRTFQDLASGRYSQSQRTL